MLIEMINSNNALRKFVDFELFSLNLKKTENYIKNRQRLFRLELFRQIFSTGWVSPTLSHFLLGGAVAIDLCAREEYASKVWCLVVENTFTTIPDMAKVLLGWRLLHYVPLAFYKSKVSFVT